MLIKKVFPVLLFLAFSLGIATFCFDGDYTLAVTLNWDLSLPWGGRCVYEADSGASFQGDGFRYHVLEYASGAALDGAAGWEDTVPEAAQADITALLDALAVPSEERPDLAACRCFTASGTDDPRDQLWLLLLPGARQRLYIVESFL